MLVIFHVYTLHRFSVMKSSSSVDESITKVKYIAIYVGKITIYTLKCFAVFVCF